MQTVTIQVMLFYSLTVAREYRVTMAEELRNLPIQGDYVTPPP